MYFFDGKIGNAVGKIISVERDKIKDAWVVISIVGITKIGIISKRNK